MALFSRGLQIPRIFLRRNATLTRLIRLPGQSVRKIVPPGGLSSATASRCLGPPSERLDTCIWTSFSHTRAHESNVTDTMCTIVARCVTFNANTHRRRHCHRSSSIPSIAREKRRRFSERPAPLDVGANRRDFHRHICTRAVRVLFTGTPVPFEFTPLLGCLIGVIVALLLVTVMILAALKVRNERRAQRPGDLPLKKATAPSSEDLYDADDRNPDVVPTNKGK